MTRKTILLFTAGLVVVSAAALWAVGARNGDRGRAPAELVRLGPYAPDMNLRAAFESLPAGEERTALTLLLDNTDAWVARWQLLAQAQETLDISYFILREDLFGAAFLGHLLKKAREGVKIRLLFDAQGTAMSFSSPRGNDWLDTLANADNVDVKLFRPLLNRYVEALFTVNPVALVASEHDKILVVDRRVGMIGGRNISAEYFADPADMPQAFEDVDVVLGGETIARHLIDAFMAQYQRQAARPIREEKVNIASFAEELLLAYQAMDAWLRGAKLAPRTIERMRELELSWPKDLAKFPRLHGAAAKEVLVPDAEAETRLLDSRTRLEARDDVIGEAIARLVQSAREQILIQSPYLVLSQDAVRLLAKAGERGVRITILTNSPISSDNALSQAFFLQQWPDMLARVPGLRIFVAGRRRTVHSKLAVFDQQVSLIGTYNLDPISMEVNSEIMAAAWSRKFALDIERHPRALLVAGAPLVYEYRIRRDADGQPVRDPSGKPVVAFGPADHASPQEWRKIQVYWTMLRAAEKIAGFAPLF